MKHIRNFSIIAHVDHGKSTLADRIIEHCGSLSEREMQSQILDTLEIERERGITVKAQSVSLTYKARNGQEYLFNFIDTPGHVDFSYEVSRSLLACEGALLVVDAAQGVEAQTVANCYTAIDQGLEVIPVLNKIDLPTAEPDRVIKEIEDIIGIQAEDAVRLSAKTGIGVDDLLEVIVNKIPPPKGSAANPLQALIVDSWYNKYLGVTSLVRVFEGELSTKDKIQVMSTKRSYLAEQVGIFTPKRMEQDKLGAGEVGYVVAGIKDINGAPVGDTLTTAARPAQSPVPGFKRVHPQVYSGLFPVDPDEFEELRDALGKLALNDSGLFYEPENSQALGFGFRCGFLGMLHMEIIQERLEREYSLNLITTAPTVIYEVETTKGEVIHIDNPAKLPPPGQVAEIREPMVWANILVPQQYVGPVINLCIERRGTQKKIQYHGNHVSLSYELPMSEVVADFFDQLKSVSRGYASLDYSFNRFETGDVVRLDTMINGERFDALSIMVHRDQAYQRGREIVQKMKEVIPRQMYDVAVQAAIGSHIIARETVKAMRKNVTAKCYGGDITRKRKLLEKQKAGKKRMKQFGSVEIPQEAFLAVLHTGKNQ